VKVSYKERSSEPPGPQAMGLNREVKAKALAGGVQADVIEPRKQRNQMPTPWIHVEGNTDRIDIARDGLVWRGRRARACTRPTPRARTERSRDRPRANPSGREGKAKATSPR